VKKKLKAILKKSLLKEKILQVKGTKRVVVEKKSCL
jgi:hypothetical protein